MKTKMSTDSKDILVVETPEEAGLAPLEIPPRPLPSQPATQTRRGPYSKRRRNPPPRRIIDESDSDIESEFPIPVVMPKRRARSPSPIREAAPQEPGFLGKVLSSIGASASHVMMPFLAYFIFQLIGKYTQAPPTLPPENKEILEKKTPESSEPPIVASSVSSLGGAYF